MSNIQELIVTQERGSLNSNDGENKTQARVASVILSKSIMYYAAMEEKNLIQTAPLQCRQSSRLIFYFSQRRRFIWFKQDVRQRLRILGIIQTEGSF